MGVAIPQVVSEDKAGGAQVIDGGLMFDNNKPTYLTRTPSSAGNQKTWTWSGWIKRGDLGRGQYVFSCFGDTSNRVIIGFISTNAFYADSRIGGADVFVYQTNALFRDTSSWYHIVLSVDSTQSTESNRLKIYINGVNQELTVSTTLSQNANTYVNTTNIHSIGQHNGASYLNAYASNIYLIDGQALDASYFGYTDPLTNVWRPKKFKPQATPNNGTVWSNNWTASGDGFGSYPVSNIFDGNSSNFMNNNSGGQIVTWNTSSYTLGGRLRIYGYSSSGLYDVYVNGSKVADTGSSVAWIDCGTIANINEVQFAGTTYNTNNGLGTAGIYVYIIEINGVPLLDSDTTNMGANGFYLPFDGSAPIGQDQSGRGNNWTPVNFGGSNTIEKATGALPILNTDGGGKVARVGVRTDANASSLVLALPLVGVKDDVSNRVNSGSTTKTVTATNAVASSSQSNFYGGSWYFDGTGDYLSIADSNDFSFGSGNFTIEAWIYPTSYGSFPLISSQYGSTEASRSYFFSLGGSNTSTLNFYWYDGAGGTDNLVAGSVALNKWSHVAAVRNGNVFSIYVDGVQVGSKTSTITLGNSSEDLRIGQDSDGTTYNFTGYMQDHRIYKGLAKYTSNFIPASTDPDIVPDSPSGVSYSSNVVLVPSTDGAVAFDGSGDYLNVGTSSDYAFGTGDYTVECFVYHTTSGSQESYFSDQFGNQAGVYFYKTTGNVLGLYYSSSIVTGSLTLSPGRWHHIAVCRSSGTSRLFVNGVLDGSASDTTNLTQTQYSIGDSYDSSSGCMNGFISNLHIVKGTALYTSNFTPPTAPISSVANTKLLCCKSNSSATAYDVSPGTITANGNAVASNFNPFTVNINTQRGKQSGYATLNPVDNPSSCTLSNGNLSFSYTATQSCTRATVGIPTGTGKYYWENYVATVGAFTPGIADSATNRDTDYVGESAGSYGLFSSGGTAYKYNNNSGSSISGTGYAAGDTVMIAYDSDTRNFYAGCNGIWYNGSDPVAGTNPLYTVTSNTYYPAIGGGVGGVCSGSINFGQKPFKFPPPAGFQPLTLANTPRPTIVRPDQYVGIVTYTGTGATRSLNVGFKPDLVWFKSRSTGGGGYNNIVFDSVRGASKSLATDLTTTEYTGTDFTSFDSNGFTVGAVNQWYGVNNNTTTFVAWCWKAGGSGGGNSFWKDDVGYATASAAGLTAGTITPTGASVNTKSGFSILTYSISSASSSISTFSHGLNNTPSFAIFKVRNAVDNWTVYHSGISNPTNNWLTLNATDAAGGNTSTFSASSATFGCRETRLVASGGSGNVIVYLWAEIPGFSKFGSYTGNGSSDGPVIITGFRPKFIIMKAVGDIVGDVEQWIIRDSTRSPYNAANANLYANLSNAEDDASGYTGSIDILSNGFKLRGTYGGINGSTTYIYAAFAEAPTFNLYGAQANAR